MSIINKTGGRKNVLSSPAARVLSSSELCPGNQGIWGSAGLFLWIYFTSGICTGLLILLHLEVNQYIAITTAHLYAFKATFKNQYKY